MDQVELIRIIDWATGRCDDALHVALLVKTADGDQLAIALPAEAAIALGEEMAAQGIRQLSARGALN